MVHVANASYCVAAELENPKDGYVASAPRNIEPDVVSVASGRYGPVKGRRAMLITVAFVALWVSVNMGLFFVLWFFAEGAAKLRVLNRVGERRSRRREAPKL
jgi:hypothetical protein